MFVSKFWIWPSSVLFFLLVTSDVVAQEKKQDPSKAQVRRLQQVQRQLEQEKTELVEAKQVVENDLRAARRRVDAESRRTQAVVGDLEAQRQINVELTSRIKQIEEDLARLREAKKGVDVELQRNVLVLQGEKQAHQACVARVDAVSALSRELIGLYEQKTCLDSLAQREPLTGLKQVEIENAVETLHERLDQARAGSQPQ